jgi:spermidine synthase
MPGAEKILESFHSAFQHIHVTEDAVGLRILRFGEEGATQSAIRPENARYLQLAYTRLVPASLAFVEDAQRILIVGLGGGALPRFFHSHFAGVTIDVVEIDVRVLEVAKRHFGLVEDERLRVFIEDGRDFIEGTEEKYDLIILDCYDGENMPAHLTTLEFLASVRDALTVSGAVVANVWGPATNPLYAAMLATYRLAFQDVYIFDVPGPNSKLFLAFSTKRLISRDSLIQRCRAMRVLRQFEYNLEGVVAGFRNSDRETTRPAGVLKD